MRRLHSLDLDSDAMFRLKVMDAYSRMEKKNVTYLCSLFGISRAVFYKWRKRYNPYNLSTLKTHSRRPQRMRTIPWSVVVEICQWKRDNPAKSHYYLYQLWLSQGRIPPCSPKTIYNWWKKRNLIIIRHRRKRRKTKLFNKASVPGELIQMDTKFLPNRRFQYTAIDVVSKYRYLKAYSKLTQESTVDYLKKLMVKFHGEGIRVQMIQTDNGHEFQSEMVKHLESVNIKHQYIWIHTPDQNGVVERSHRTDDEEFYQQTETRYMSLDELNQALEQWTLHYNTKRLHFSLNFATPEKYLEKYRVSTI